MLFSVRQSLGIVAHPVVSNSSATIEISMSATVSSADKQFISAQFHSLYFVHASIQRTKKTNCPEAQARLVLKQVRNFH